MRAATAFFLLFLATAVTGQITASTTINVAASQSTAATGSFTAGSGLTAAAFTLAFNTLIGSSISVTSTSTTAFALTITAVFDTNFAANVTSNAFLSNSGLGFSLLTGAYASPVYLTFSGGQTASAGSTLTITVTPVLTLGVTASGDKQLHLFAQGTATDGTNSAGGSGSANANANYYGAVAVSGSGNTLSYTLSLPVDPNQKYVLGTATKANFAAGSATAADSSAFVSSNGYLPVALGNVFNYAAGVQYRAGNNLYIAAQASTSFTVNNAQTFAASGSTAPATTFGTIGYGYQINSAANSNGNVVLRWNGQTSAFTGGSSTTAAAATTYTTAAWYKSSASAATAATWARQASTATVDASGNVNVMCRASSFSQWTVGASSSATAAKAGAVFVALMVLFAMLV